MGRYILRRLVISVPLLFGITVITFVIINAAPGDPITAFIDHGMSAEDQQLRKAALGLNEPVPVRYLLWLNELLHGNLGYSILTGRPVAERVTQRLGASLQLMFAALFISLVLALPIGIMSAYKQYSRLDYAATVLAFGAVSMPGFFLGLGMIFVFSLKLNWLPTSGMFTIGAPFSIEDRLRHLMMPAFVLGLANTAALMRYTRSSMLEVLRQEYIGTARAKGLAEWVVVNRHALPNALIPVVTIIGLSVPTMLGGSVIIESIFQWPGMGMLSIEAIRQRDYPVLMGINLVAATSVLVANLLTDLAYAWLDPRIRYE